MIYLGIVLLVLAALLAIPFDIIFKIQSQQERQSDIAIIWLFGVVRFPVSGAPGRPSKKPKKTKKAPKRKGESTNFNAIKSLFFNARFRNRLIRFIKDIFRTIRIASFYLRIRLGLDDPADTGRLWAYLGPLAVYLTTLSNATISLVPDFQTETLDYDGSGRVRIVPLQVIFTVLAFVFSPITIQALWRMRKAGKQ